jgi:hypothetical protein
MPKHLIQACPYRKLCPAVLMVQATEDRYHRGSVSKRCVRPARLSGGSEHLLQRAYDPDGAR